jgi:hypothetical protein
MMSFGRSARAMARSLVVVDALRLTVDAVGPKS